jgi:hypothetical protein
MVCTIITTIESVRQNRPLCATNGIPRHVLAVLSFHPEVSGRIAANVDGNSFAAASKVFPECRCEEKVCAHFHHGPGK